MFLYKFNKKAIHKGQVTSKSGQEMRTGVKETEFACYEETGKVRNQRVIASGVVSGAVSLTLRTYDKIAESIKPNDTIVYENNPYSVNTITKVRSSLKKDAFEYLIGLE